MSITDRAGLEDSPRRRRSGYLGVWKRVPADLGFLLLGLPIAAVGFSVALTLFAASIGTLITVFIGLALLVALLYTSRAFGNVELARLEWAGEPPIRRPEWRDPRASTGLWGRMKSVIGNGHYWLYFL